jgi:hypothetical protein
MNIPPAGSQWYMLSKNHDTKRDLAVTATPEKCASAIRQSYQSVYSTRKTESIWLGESLLAVMEYNQNTQQITAHIVPHMRKRVSLPWRRLQRR